MKEAEKAVPLVKKSLQIIKMILQKVPQLKSMKYSDADLHNLAKKVSEKEKPQMIKFLLDLYQNHQITREQLKKYVPETEIAKREEGKKIELPGRSDRLFAFLLPCLEKHMRVGARFSCYLEDPESKYQDPLFEKEVILNPFLEYKEHWIDVEVPKNCRYFTGRKALVITITKL